MTTYDRQNVGLDGNAALRRHRLFHRVLSADPLEVRRTLLDIRVRFREEVGEDTLGRTELILAEVMNNITEHAGSDQTIEERLYAPLIHLSIASHVTGLACAISDDGQSLPNDCLQPRALQDVVYPDLPEGGFGWFLIHDLTQSLCYYREGSRNFLAFTVPFAAE